MFPTEGRTRRRGDLRYTRQDEFAVLTRQPRHQRANRGIPASQGFMKGCYGDARDVGTRLAGDDLPFSLRLDGNRLEAALAVLCSGRLIRWLRGKRNTRRGANALQNQP